MAQQPTPASGTKPPAQAGDVGVPASNGGGASIAPGSAGANKPGSNVPAGARVVGATVTPQSPGVNTPGAQINTTPFVISSVHQRDRYIKLLVYGGYGSGKTRLAASSVLVPAMRDVLMIDAESGDLTVATIDEPEFKEGIKYLDNVSITTFKMLARVQEFLKLHCQYRDANNEEKLKELEMKLRPESDPNAPARRYQTVIIDSLSEVETYSMYQLLGVTDRLRLDDEAASAEWAEYKRNHNMILRLVRAFRDLPMNVIMTSAANYTQDESKRFVYQPALTGKLAKQVQGFMDVVGFLTVEQQGEEYIRKLHVQPTPRFDAKNRFSVYRQNYFEQPTLKGILQSVGLLDKAAKAK